LYEYADLDLCQSIGFNVTMIPCMHNANFAMKIPSELKKIGHYSFLYLCKILTNFWNSFISRLSRKWSLKIPSHLKCVATLPY